MKRPILVIVLLLITVLGAAGGYFAGDRWDIPAATASGDAAPLGQVTPAGPTPSQTPSDPPLPVKTPVPNTIPPLETDLSFRRRTFTVSPKDYQAVQMAIDVPDGWHFKTDPKRPAEVKYLDPRNERGVRVEASRPPISTKDALDGLIIDLKKSLPPQDDLRIQSQTTEQIVGDDDQTRTVSTLVYTYIPTDTLRYVIVRWVSTNGDDLANVEMSITGLPDDSAALEEVLLRATQSVRETG